MALESVLPESSCKVNGKTNPKELKVLSHNISELHDQAKMCTLLYFCKLFSYDVITLTETHLNKHTEAMFAGIFEKDFWIKCLNRLPKNSTLKSSGG